MARASFSIDIERPADDILEFILDVENYRAVDPRLGSIRWVRRAPHCTVFRFRPALMGLPAPLTTQMVTRHGATIEILSLPSMSDRLVAFTGSLVCTESGGVTRATRSLSFDLRRPIRFLDRRLQRWLEKDVPAEMRRLKAHLESDKAGGASLHET